MLVEDWKTGAEVEVVEAGGMSRPMPPIPGIEVTGPLLDVSAPAKTPMKSSRRGVVDLTMVVPGS